MIICMDSNCVIYLIEQNAVWAPKVAARMAAAATVGDTLAVCDLARVECLVKPLQLGDASTVADFENFFNGGSVQMLATTVPVYERAARIRVATSMKIKLLDAIHLAAAAEHGCGLFLTNDVQLAQCTDIAVEILT